MKVSASSLRGMLNQSVCDIRFVRRNPKPGASRTRRMLCTTSRTFLETIAAKSVFGFSPPAGNPKYNASAKNLVMAYDLFMQNFRAVNGDEVEVLQVFPTNTEAQINEFWKHFSENIAPMSAADKERFMNT